jgi:hypothetical protein
VSDDGEPYATRGWGIDVLSPDATSLRVLLYANDERALALLAPGRRIAITAGDVRTLASVQLKGVVERVEDGTSTHLERANRYCDDFFRDIEDIDGTRPELAERLRPNGVVPIVVRIDERYDQTPGPGAGAEMS